MICPHCHSDAIKVIDSRDALAEPAVRRRRECETCTFRFTTYERIEVPQLWIVKKDGRREHFDRTKLTRSIWQACGKRPISESDIESLVGRIESDLRNSGEGEVAAATLGELVMTHLKGFDDIAYIRFASVYRQFTDLGELQREVAEALDRPKPLKKQTPLPVIK